MAAPRQAGPTIRRSRPLPSGRAVLGGLLIALAALGTFVAASDGSGEPNTRFSVATRAVDRGDRLTAADLDTVAIDLPATVAGQAFSDPAALVGAVAIAPLRAGALVQASQVLPPGDGDPAPAEASHELSLRLPQAQAVDGTLNRGEWVDVLATYGSGADAVTQVVVRDAVVTAIGHDDAAGLGDEGGLTLTLLLPDDDAVLRTTHAKDVATVTLVRSTRDDDGPEGSDRYRGPLDEPPDDSPAAGPADTAGP